MTENISPELGGAKEKGAEKYILHFEPGIHPFPLTDILLRHPTKKEILERFDNGDLTAHVWNPEVAQRMREYSPLVLGLDSEPPDWPANLKITWPFLPGSPKEMSGRDMMYLVAGDVLHSDILGEPGLQAELDKLGWGRVKEYAIKWSVEQGATLAWATMILVPLLKKLSSERLSRRSFLKASAIVSGLGLLTAAASRFGSIFLQPYSPTAKIEGIAGVATELTKPRFSESKWLHGRTALLITKTEEAMELLGLPSGTHASVVMGSPHAYEAYKFLKDEGARMQAIKEYAQQLFDDIYPNLPDTVWDSLLKGGHIKSKEDTKAKKQYLMDLIALPLSVGLVSEIHEPKSNSTNTPIETTQNLTKQVGWFLSPKVERVTRAIGGNPTRFIEILEENENIWGPRLSPKK